MTTDDRAELDRQAAQIEWLRAEVLRLRGLVEPDSTVREKPCPDCDNSGCGEVYGGYSVCSTCHGTRSIREPLRKGGEDMTTINSLLTQIREQAKTPPKPANQRTVAEVMEAKRYPGGACCDRNMDNRGCSCMADAERYEVSLRVPPIPHGPFRLYEQLRDGWNFCGEFASVTVAKANRRHLVHGVVYCIRDRDGREVG